MIWNILSFMFDLHQTNNRQNRTQHTRTHIYSATMHIVYILPSTDAVLGIRFIIFVGGISLAL